MLLQSSPKPAIQHASRNGLAVLTMRVSLTLSAFHSPLTLPQITYMLSTLLAVVTIDRWGRRIGLYWGAIGQGISLILAGAFARLLKDHPEKATQYGGAAAFFVFSYTFVFGATWLTIPWVYPTETFPLEVRARGNAFGVFGWSIGNGYVFALSPVVESG